MTRLLAGALVGLLPVSGCAPIQQVEWRTPSEKVQINANHGYIHVNVFTGLPKGSAKPNINEATSYAENASHRFKLRTEVNTYVDQSGGSQRAWRVYLVDEAQPDNPLWANGDWRLHLEFSGTKTPVAPIDAEFRLTTFFYSPLVHGAPN